MKRVPLLFDLSELFAIMSIVIHALEHLGTTDRGITMFRRLVREGIRAVQRGEDPKGLVWQEGGVPATYSNDTVLRIPPAPTREADLKLLRETGWRGCRKRSSASSSTGSPRRSCRRSRRGRRCRCPWGGEAWASTWA